QIHHVRRFISFLHGKGYSGRTLARMLSAWRSLYNYLTLNNGYAHNPCVGVRAPKPKKKLPATLSPDEAAKLLDFQPSHDPMVLRGKAMLELCYSSGLRLAE